MPTITRFRVLSGQTDDVWQELTDFRGWPRLSAHISQVDLVGRASDSLLLEIRNQDGLMLKASASEDHGDRSMRVTIDPVTPHPLGVTSLRFVVAESIEENERVDVTVSADYRNRVPLVGGLLTRSARKAERISFIDSWLDGLSQFARRRHWQFKDNVRTVLSHKGHTVVTASPDDQLGHIANLMANKNIGVVLIVNTNNALMGMVSERDIVKRLSQSGAAALGLTAAQAMTRDLIVVEPQTDLMHVMTCMTENKVRHLPVMENDKLVGLISIGDVVVQRIQALQADSDTLRDYIAAREWRYRSPYGAPAQEKLENQHQK